MALLQSKKKLIHTFLKRILFFSKKKNQAQFLARGSVYCTLSNFRNAVFFLFKTPVQAKRSKIKAYNLCAHTVRFHCQATTSVLLAICAPVHHPAQLSCCQKRFV